MKRGPGAAPAPILVAEHGFDLSKAACRDADPDAFHPIGDYTAPPEVIAICKGCDVIDACLAYAMANPNLSGIWGGTTFGQRRNTRRRQQGYSSTQCPDCGRRGHGRCTDEFLCADYRMSRSNDD